MRSNAKQLRAKIAKQLQGVDKLIAENDKRKREKFKKAVIAALVKKVEEAFKIERGRATKSASTNAHAARSHAKRGK